MGRGAFSALANKDTAMRRSKAGAGNDAWHARQRTKRQASSSSVGMTGTHSGRPRQLPLPSLHPLCVWQTSQLHLQCTGRGASSTDRIPHKSVVAG